MIDLSGKRTKRTGSRVFLLFTMPALVMYLFFIIYPMLNGLFYSLTDWNGIKNSFNFIGLQNYLNIFTDKKTMDAFQRTVIYTVELMCITTVLSILIAVLLNMKIRARGFFRAVYFFPAVLSSITMGLIFNQIYSQLLPSIGKALEIDFLSTSLLSRKETAMYAILFINVWQHTAMPTVIILAGMQSISADLYEAAAIDGANAWQQFKRITIPLILPSIAIVSILTMRSGLMVFDYIKATTDGGPGFNTTTIAVLIYKHAFSDFKFAYSSAESFLVFIITFVLAIVQLAITRRKD